MNIEINEDERSLIKRLLDRERDRIDEQHRIDFHLGDIPKTSLFELRVKQIGTVNSLERKLK
jgi:hypothetical protein